MKRRVLGVVLLALSTACFMMSLNADQREYAYGLLSAAYLLFILAVFATVSRLVSSSRVTHVSRSR
ncbi:hypothetical protein OK351_10360 [Glutamicibacter sp. MNS18]|uniref:hypothetical protein n=1 Tax=Glutamicibacter sp. MNS18 TaxID=2989817 RepID=UPI002235FD99|nr:hypothetical protein [Glutamicibacter sp. MNS18]MCW4465906.1 hypothetical protein [Glutamicibacter sp. MNS18]